MTVAKLNEQRELTMAQLDLAWHLAKDFPLSQRIDVALLNEMRKKQAFRQSSVHDNTTSPDNSIPKPQQKASAAAKKPKYKDDWEDAALLGIEKKKLGLDRDWSVVTWINKSSRNERLKLLKDDGVDITLLQTPNTSSDTITRAVLAQIKNRKQLFGGPAQPQPPTGNHNKPKEVSGAVDHAAASPPDPTFAHHVYHPLMSPPLKRKQEKESGLHLVDISRPSVQVPKKRCTTDLRMSTDNDSTVSEEETPTWDMLKGKILTDIFAPTKTMRVRPALRSSCRIIISFPSQSASVDVPGDFELSSTGYDNIMLELKALHDTVDDEDGIGIHDPVATAFPASIRVITNQPRRTIIQGHAPALIGLMRRLSTPGKGLAHIAKRHFDDQGIRRTVGEVYELSANTQKQLENISEALVPAVEGDSVEVHVRWIHVGKTVPWKEKFY
jgi:hypothetical protein